MWQRSCAVFFFLPKNKTILVQSQLADSRTGPRCIRSYSYISFRTEFNALQRTTPSLLIVATVCSRPLYALLYFTSCQVVMFRTDTVYCLFSGHRSHPLLRRLDLSCLFWFTIVSFYFFKSIMFSAILLFCMNFSSIPSYMSLGCIWWQVQLFFLSVHYDSTKMVCATDIFIWI